MVKASAEADLAIVQEDLYRAKVYPLSRAYRCLCEQFLRMHNPYVYGDGVLSATDQQAKALAEATESLQATALALQAAGNFNMDTDPVRFSSEDPRNLWAYSGKLHRPLVKVSLPLLGKYVSLMQFWMQKPDFSAGGLVDAHTTGSVVWDGAVCLADFL
eukprot:CAMPEP_0117692494 /NCGR_PEP_ID=MMETSP0804-20121206/26361_1 /TAXON_ID=1074897 /ORGANISM="Tetraselmis astigmatica, Strain CCMP880" /LENGTH=158 /DNA_ID=CAMNT_0005505953 /DNA_START=386 /DNA_END=858 /DNA_ORIENTATION=-